MNPVGAMAVGIGRQKLIPVLSGAAARPAAVLAIYIAAIFLSAATLFAVEPMFTKIVLPQLGGAPSVWSIAIAFFQTGLFAGYAYAHLITRWFPAGTAVMVHVAVMLAATLFLPLAIAAGWERPPAHGETLWLIGLFAMSIGLPFFALSANGPLLQAWFARSGQPGASNPYFLYAASNVGSFLALVSYPLVVEPFMRLSDQVRAWTLMFYALIALIATCGVLLIWHRAGAYSGASREETAAPPRWHDAMAWIALSAVPAGLLIAVTAYISTDIASAPFLWVIPLALYLATFVIAFQRRPIIPHWLAVYVQPFFIVAIAAIMIFDVQRFELLVAAVNVAGFFVTALVCHSELARRRPAPAHLTAFYMWMSAGGMIGGISTALIAPHVFSWVAEYPLLIALAILCRPDLAWPTSRREQAFCVLVLALAALGTVPAWTHDYQLADWRFEGIIAVLLVLSLVFSGEPLTFAALIVFAFMVQMLYGPDVDQRVNVRSFFGVNKITSHGEFRVLTNGTTIHGAERIADIEASGDKRPEPLTYYHAHSALVRVIKAVRARRAGSIRIGIVGLGTGSLSCYAEPGDTLRFFEIDPAVVQIARDATRFNFLSRCASGASILIGDARLTLGDEADQFYDVIVVDAFSSDTIPIHLLTREAMRLYLQKLAPGGLIAVHLSNWYLELASVVAGIAHANGLIARTNPEDGDEHKDVDQYKFTSTVTVAARMDEDFGALANSENGWPIEQPDRTQRTWTDDYCNIVGAIIRKLRDSR
jgi:hypothetical protein